MNRIPGYFPTEDDLALESAVLGYWTRLAATGDPNGDSAVKWPRYEREMDPYLDLAIPIEAAAGARTEYCDFWETFTP